jgi:hypothetical protein
MRPKNWKRQFLFYFIFLWKTSILCWLFLFFVSDHSKDDWEQLKERMKVKFIGVMSSHIAWFQIHKTSFVPCYHTSRSSSITSPDLICTNQCFRYRLIIYVRQLWKCSRPPSYFAPTIALHANTEEWCCPLLTNMASQTHGSDEARYYTKYRGVMVRWEGPRLQARYCCTHDAPLSILAGRRAALIDSMSLFRPSSVWRAPHIAGPW